MIRADDPCAAQRQDPVDSLAARCRRLVADGLGDLPRPGAGSSSDRLRGLADIAAVDLPLARLAEAHLDAVTILREAGRQPEDGVLYGVWASDPPHARLVLSRPGGRWELTGVKPFCTGAGLVDRALITATFDDQVVLVDLATSSTPIGSDASGWITTAFAATDTATNTFDRVEVADDRIVGPPGWYLDRVGFWHGALAPAACWAGGAIGLVDHCVDMARSGRSSDEHTLGHLGMLDAAAWSLRATLDAAGAAIDESPSSRPWAMQVAYRCRAVVERTVSGIIDDAVRAHGPRLLAYDDWASRRVAELELYVRQHHGRRDHATLGRLLLREEDPAR